MILDKINSPKDLKNVKIEDLNVLAEEIRQLIIKKINTTGGHMGPNLGFLEATIALHYVFDTPKDKIVFDISHQCYTHKILTGRKDGFLEEKNYHKYSGFTAPEESEYDLFKIGHTSTSVSLATGLAKARDINKTKENVIAVIGDGSLTGGEALEGLNNAAVLNSNMIIVVNDNGMSIAENQGGIHNHLQDLRNGKADNNLFESLGFEYFYLKDGNNVKKLVETFEKFKDVNHPVVLHLYTNKGNGLKQAEENKEKFHYVQAHVLDDDNQKNEVETYNSLTINYLLDEVNKDNNIVVITPATPGATGLTDDVRKKLGKHYVDVGIAEQHAVGFLSGIGKNGAKPVLMILSSFIQRAYDQLSQDLALNNIPSTILVDWASISGSDATHLGVFDIPLISNIPNIVYLAPTNKEEYLAMLDWSVNKNNKHSVAIRVPTTSLISNGIKDETDYSIINKYKLIEKGEKVAIFGVGNFFELAKNVKKDLLKNNINATLINPCFISGLDKELLDDLKKDHNIIITLEDGIIEGGFGQKIASYYGKSDIKVLNYGADKLFTDRVPLDTLYNNYRLKKELIIEDILNIIK